VQFASDVDEATQKRIRQGQLMTEILKQEDLAPIPFEKQVIVFYAVLNGYFDKIDLASAKDTEGRFLDYIEKLHDKDILTPLREKGEMTGEIEDVLKKSISRFLES